MTQEHTVEDLLTDIEEIESLMRDCGSTQDADTRLALYLLNRCLTVLRQRLQGLLH